MSKRPDIQGIRGLAIGAVLAFHLDDATFPSGFVGVDMFFVLSGYLMAVILAKESELNITVFRKFYTRRFKRIVPLYAMLIVALTVLVPCFLLRRDVLKFCEDVVWAAVFSTNIQSVVEEKDYFTELSDSNVLTHTWSLGVEIQYYIIVPFIVLAHRKLPQKWNLFLILLLIASWVCQLLSSPNVAFNLLTSRVWQFIAGGLAYELSSSPFLGALPTGSTVKYQKLNTEEEESVVVDIVDEEEHDQPKLFKGAIESLSVDLLSFALIALVLSPWSILPIPALRFIAILMTGGLLVLGCDESRQGFLLTNRLIVYLGDLSYVIYLAHWPIIIMWKSVADTLSLSPYGIFSCLAITFKISIVVHHTAEQYFIRAKTKIVSVVVAVIYAFLAIALIFNVPLRISTGLEGPAASIDVEAAIKWNEQESHTRYWNKRPFKDCVDDPEGQRMRDGFTSKKEYECVWKPKNATGSLKILVVGNSISHRATKILKPIIEENFPQVALMRLFAKSSCSPTDNVKGCGPFINAIPKLVDAMQPDVTFMIYDNSRRMNAPLLNPSDDAVTADLTLFLQKLTNSSSYVVLDEFYPQPSTSAGMATSMHKRLLRNQSTTDLKGTLESFQTKYANYFARLDHVHIPNLIRHNTSADLCAEEKGVCWWYNRRNLHAYFTDNLHFTTDGLELLRASYTKIIKDVIERLGA